MTHRFLRHLCAAFFLALAVPALAAGGAAECPRIVSQSPYLTMALEWLGRGACIVGVSRYDRRSDLPRTGGLMDPDFPAIAALEPDLFVTSNWVDAEQLEMAMPAGARLLRVDGFRSLADAEAMLRTLARASRAPGAEARIAAFRRDVKRRTAAVAGKGRRVLVLSACGRAPYSFGRDHYVADAFVQAGFDVVETAPRIRHMRPGEELPSILDAVERLKPEIVFSLDPINAEQCSAELGLLPVRLVTLHGEHFFHPGPGLLAGYDELAAKMKTGK